MELNLKDKIVLITGASGGIGTAICHEFLVEGSIVYACYNGNENKIKTILESDGINQEMKNKLFPLKMNVTDQNSVKEGFRIILNKFVKIDVLVNCAGISNERPFLLTEEEEWEKIMTVNLSSIARLCRHALKPMFREKKGAIVNVSSVLGSRFGRGNIPYAVSKAGINRFTQALATEIGPKGIRINAVCPGIIETTMSHALKSRLGDNVTDIIPLQRNGKPEEVAKAVVFLASEKAASYITGTTLIIDGGISV